MKKKREKCVTHENYKLKIPLELHFKDSKIQNLFEKLKNSDCFEVQQQVITELATFFKKDGFDDHKPLILKLITHIFLTVNSKLPIKKTIVRILSGLDSAEIESCLVEHLRGFIKSLKDIDDHKALNDLCNCILSCTENFAPGLRAVSVVATDLFKFTVNFLKQLVLYVMSDKLTTVQIKQETFSHVHNTTRVLLFLLQKCSVDTCLSEVSVEVVTNCWNILNSNEINFDTKKNCGLIIVYSFKFLPTNITENFVFKDNPVLELLACSSNYEQDIQILGIRNFCNDYSVKLAVYCGILNIVPKNVLLAESMSNILVIAYLFKEIIDCLKQTTSISAQVLEVSHALTLLSKSLDKMPLEPLKPLFNDGLNYVWTHLDHHVDTVRHMTKTVFKNFIQLASLHKQSGNDCLLRKIFEDVNSLPLTSVTRYIALYILASEISCSSVLLNMKLLLPKQMLENIKDPTLAPQICTLYEYLMEKHFIELTPGYEDVWILQWVKIILPYLKQTEAISFYQRLAITAFKINPAIIRIIVKFEYRSTPAEFGVLLGCLRVIRKEDMEVEFYKGVTHYVNLLTLQLNAYHQDDEIRVSVLALIVESQKTTEIYTSGELTFLRKYLFHNISAQKTSTRREIIHFYKKAFTRMSDSLAVLNRSVKNDRRDKKIFEIRKDKCSMQLLYDVETMIDVSANDTDTVDEAENTRNLYMKFLSAILRGCLLPGILNDSNFARKSVALELLVAFHQTFKEKEWKDLWLEEDLSNLKYVIIFDTYEANKQNAVQLYKLVSPQVHKTKERTVEELKNTLSLASDIKPCKTIAAAYMFEVCLLSPHALEAIREISDLKENNTGNALWDLIVFLLQQLEEKNKQNFQVDKYFCTYGIVLSVRHLLQKVNFLENASFWRNILTNQLINICFKIYERVGPIVTNQSPEGNLPDDCEILDNISEEIDESTKAQALLVYAWRNVKEISLLLGDIAAKIIACEDKIKLIDDDLLLKIGNFFIDLFVRTKHRGVFEQAYLGFYKLCEGFWRSNNLKLKELPEIWLNKMLNILSGNIDETCDSLCATRRSAGLPFLILAILATEPIPRANKSFHHCIKTLLNTTNDLSPENNERRTHCINVLRAIYRHNQLGELVSQYVAAGMIAAVTGMKSTDWGIRNSATLLFSALVTRMFGVQRTKDSDSLSTKNKMTVKVFFMRYPELHQFLLKELSEGCENSSSLTIYPILLILSRLYPSNLDDSDLKEYLPLVNKCLYHPNFRTRELAACASIPFIPHSDCVEHIIKLLNLLSNVKLSNNELHGLLSQLLHLLKKHRGEDLSMNNLAKHCEPTFWILLYAGTRVSYLLAALYLDILVLFISMFKISMADESIFTRPIDKCYEMDIPRNIINTKDFIINLHYVKMYLIAVFPIFQNVMAATTANEIRINLYSEHGYITAFYLNLIACLNYDKPNYSKHCLYVSEEFEIPEKEYSLARAFTKDFRQQLLEHLHPFIRDIFLRNFYTILRDDECRLPALLVLRYYPCIIAALFPMDRLFDYFLYLPIYYNEECISAAIICISSYLRKYKSSDLRQLKLEPFMELLMESSCPTVALHRRLAVCDFLLDNKNMYFSNDLCVGVKVFCDIWEIILTLLEDEDCLVRNNMSKLNTRDEASTHIESKVGLDMIAEYVREELMLTFKKTVPARHAVAFLFKWSLRHKPDHIDNDMSVVFTKAYHNLYAETTPVAKIAVILLKQLLWTLEDGLNYEDKSIFIEEQAVLVTWILINAASRPNHVIAKNTRRALLGILKTILDFLQRYHINRPSFKTDFRKLLMKEYATNGLIKQLNKNDFYNLHMFLWTIYNPIL